MCKALSITDMSPMGNIFYIDEGLLVSSAIPSLHLSKSNLQAPSCHTLENQANALHHAIDGLHLRTQGVQEVVSLFGLAKLHAFGGLAGSTWLCCAPEY